MRHTAYSNHSAVMGEERSHLTQSSQFCKCHSQVFLRRTLALPAFRLYPKAACLNSHTFFYAYLTACDTHPPQDLAQSCLVAGTMAGQLIHARHPGLLIFCHLPYSPLVSDTGLLDIQALLFPVPGQPLSFLILQFLPRARTPAVLTATYVTAKARAQARFIHTSASRM